MPELCGRADARCAACLPAWSVPTTGAPKSRYPPPGGSVPPKRARSPTSPGGISSRIRCFRTWYGPRSRTTRISRSRPPTSIRPPRNTASCTPRSFRKLNAGATAERQRLSKTTALGSGTGRGLFNDFGVNLSASFELDIWGRLRRASESARASLLASQQGRGTVVLTVVTTVASGYIQLRALDRQLEIAQRTSQSLGEAARLQRVRFEEGAVPESDYQQAESQYREAVARVPELERQIAQQENFISVLLGRNPGPIPRGRDIDALLFPAVPDGLPASLLERRPDIREAEENLIAANADIGVAKAAYFPDISLTGLLGLESAELSDLFKGPSKTWSVRRGCAATDFQCRSDQQSGRAGRSSAATGPLYLRKVDHQRFPGRGERPDRSDEVRTGTRGAGEERLGAASLPRPGRTALHGRGDHLSGGRQRRAIAVHRPARVRRRRSPSSSNRMRICTRRWAAAGSKTRRDSPATSKGAMQKTMTLENCFLAEGSISGRLLQDHRPG